ncbi:MAG TPA: hypothetical protein VGX50_11175 [Longimicrobium sp.]|nr:hypothetical protein [Longimicrobium sp.]
MTDERRYGDEEVATIFERAANHPAPGGSAVASTTASTGLTLQELQAIGAEVGLEPERIADAAASLEVHRGAAAVAPRRTYLGAPVSVSRVVDLPRAPTDREWEQLVVELRQTFHAQGKQSSQGSLRSWTNGNLHALVEPTDTGYHLRMGSTKGNAIAMNRLGIGTLVVALLIGLFFLMIGELDEDATPALLIAMVGIAALAFNAIRLPSWAREREEQMDHIAARAVTIIRPGPAPDALGSGS